MVWLVLHMCAMQCSAFRGPLLLPAARPGGRGLRVQRIQPKCIAAGEGAGEGALGRRVLLVAAVLSVAGGSTATECNAAGGGDNPRSLTTQGMELFKEAKVAASELHTSARTKSYVVCFPRVAQANHRLFPPVFYVSSPAHLRCLCVGVEAFDKAIELDPRYKGILWQRGALLFLCLFKSLSCVLLSKIAKLTLTYRLEPILCGPLR